MQAKTLGKTLISATAVAQMVGPFVFDFNETHIYNKSWPPHAKFRNAQIFPLRRYTSNKQLNTNSHHLTWRDRS